MEDAQLIAYLNQSLDPEERLEVEAWLEQADHRRHFERVKQVWEAEPKIPAPDVDQAWNRVRQRIRPRTRRLQWHWRAAAGIALLIASYWVIQWQTAPEWLLAEGIAGGPPKVVELADGSTVYLKASAQLRYPSRFTRAKRQVELEGEAYFEVQRDPDHPFIVEGASEQVEVLGTAFSFTTYADSSWSKVAVTEGRVAFRASDQQEVILTLGQQAGWDRQNSTFNREELRNNELAWQTGRLVFDRADLATVAGLIEQNFGYQLNWTSPDMQNCRITTTFEQTNAAEIVEALCILHNWKSELTNKTFTLSGKGCP